MKIRFWLDFDGFYIRNKRKSLHYIFIHDKSKFKALSNPVNIILRELFEKCGYDYSNFLRQELRSIK